MYLNAKKNQKLASKVKKVLLDNKPVPMCHEANEEEGWVISYVLNPLTKDNKTLLKKEDTFDITKDTLDTVDLNLVKRYGNVKIVFKEEK